jgi:hypothetical protein
MRHRNLAQQLFADSKLNAYAVLDGASNPALLDHLYDGERIDFACLYRGDLEPDIAECAPYLVRLEANTPFADWVISNCSGRNWGIFALSEISLPVMLQHLRKFNMVYDPEDNESMLFRYYDPRVLREFLPNCPPEHALAFFGPVRSYFAEAEEADSQHRFYWDGQQVQEDIL